MCVHCRACKNTFSNFYDIKKISEGARNPNLVITHIRRLRIPGPPTQHNQLILLVIGQEISTTFNPEHK